VFTPYLVGDSKTQNFFSLEPWIKGVLQPRLRRDKPLWVRFNKIRGIQWLTHAWYRHIAMLAG
jgi:hypothetical protein